VTNIGLFDVVEYLKGSAKPHATITKGLTYPDGIAIDHASNLYVGNLQPYSTSNIQVYALGSKSPSRTITDGVTWPVGIAVDEHDTLYVTNDTAPGNVEEYRPGRASRSGR
jgi:sugar lactone lactonase YvrE